MNEIKHYISISIGLTEKLGVKNVIIDKNTTNLESDSELIKKISIALLKSISLNKNDIQVQDLLNELNFNVK